MGTETNRYEGWSDDQVWEVIVGNESPMVFVENGGDVDAYLEHSPMCEDLAGDEVETVGDAMRRLVEAVQS